MPDRDSHATTLQRVLYALALLFFLLRFLWPGDTVYILDEAFMQLRIDENFAAGTIPFSNSRGSSIPLPYGPGALWFFMLARTLLSWHPVVIVLWHLTFQMIGYALFVTTIRRAYGNEAGAWCALLAATSPILFFSSRHPWDSTLYIPLAGAILFCLQRLQSGGKELPLHAALGLLAGYAVNTHLMFGPVALALGGTLVLWNLRKHSLRKPRSWILLATFGGCALAVLLPYLIEASRIAHAEDPLAHARQQKHWGDGRNLWWIFMRTTLFSSLFKARAMLDDIRPFYEQVGQPFAFFYRIDLFGWLGKLAAWIAAFAVLLRLARLRFDDQPLRLFAALSFLFIMIVFQYLNIPMASHYFLPIWWFVFLGIAVALVTLKSPWKQVFVATLAGTALVNGSYTAFALSYLHQNKGARNMEASVAVSEQLRNLRELCAWGLAHGRGEIKIYQDAFLGAPGFEFLPHHMPECRGVSFSFTDVKGNADFFLHHPADSATSAALVADPVQGK